LSEEEAKEIHQALLRFFVSKRVSSDEAQDLIQQTFLLVLNKMNNGFKPDSSLFYSIGVARHMFHSYCRGVKRNYSFGTLDKVDYLYDSVPNPMEQAMASNNIKYFHKHLNRLPKGMKDLLVERFVKEVPAKILAKKLGTKPETIDMRVYRAKLELKRLCYG
jgi:RNA polymerase sigma factor (sigma-70 family)